jgi:sortase system peptidoglycan-associated protein
MNKLINVAASAALSAALAMPAIAEPVADIPTETKTLSLGALIGGLIAGPAGALVGGAGGAWLGKREVDHLARETDLAARLAEREARLNELELAFQQAEADAADYLHQVKLERQRSAASDLEQGLWLNVHFATGEFRVDERIIPQLDRLVVLLGQYPELQVHLEGYADPRGDARYNQQLSEARVNAVRLHLLRAGLDPARVHGAAYGESRAAKAAQSAEDWLFDRRVTLRVGFAAEA